MSELKTAIQEDMKASMKAHNKQRLGVVRLILSEIKQREVDERIELNDEQILAILDKMVKQRNGAIEQFIQGNRNDLVETEKFEIGVIKSFLPQALSPAEVDLLITQAIDESGALPMRDMSKVMTILKPQLQGRADMAAVSKTLKERFA